jgi:putative Mn2+ efflux pump MntP
LSSPEIGALAFALAVDAFSVAASAGPYVPRKWGPVRMAASFGLFQAGMPLLGGLVGAYLLVHVQAWDHWLAFGLLQLVGLKMIFEALRPGREDTGDRVRLDPSRGLALLSLSVATSIDAFGAGMGMRVAGANVWAAAPVIGIVAAGLTYVGAGLGRRAKRYLGRVAELLGGLVLMGLGVKMLGI